MKYQPVPPHEIMEGDCYFITHLGIPDKFYSVMAGSISADSLLLLSQRGLVYRTKEEAVNCADDLLAPGITDVQNMTKSLKIWPEHLGSTCMDGGRCHHDCKDRCFRRECCVPLTLALDAGLSMEQWRYPEAAPQVVPQGYRLQPLSEYDAMCAFIAAAPQPPAPKQLDDINVVDMAQGADMKQYLDSLAVYKPHPHPAEGATAQAFKTKVYQALGIGSACDEHVVFANIENLIRREHCLSAIEREFFMVETPPDEGEGDTGPGEECLLNWGHTPEQYVKQFAQAIATHPTTHELEVSQAQRVPLNAFQRRAIFDDLYPHGATSQMWQTFSAIVTAVERFDITQEKQ